MKYQRFTQSGCKDIEITKSKFVVKTQFLCTMNPALTPIVPFVDFSEKQKIQLHALFVKQTLH